MINFHSTKALYNIVFYVFEKEKKQIISEKQYINANSKIAPWHMLLVIIKLLACFKTQVKPLTIRNIVYVLLALLGQHIQFLKNT